SASSPPATVMVRWATRRAPLPPHLFEQEPLVAAPAVVKRAERGALCRVAAGAGGPARLGGAVVVLGIAVQPGLGHRKQIVVAVAALPLAVANMLIVVEGDIAQAIVVFHLCRNPQLRAGHRGRRLAVAVQTPALGGECRAARPV